MSKLTPEDVVLRYSKRGMNILKKYLKDGYCRTAAEKLLHAERGTVLLTTGFYVAGYAETDGPLGTVAVAEASTIWDSIQSLSRINTAKDFLN